jgi:hypothetical protein
MYDEKKIKLRLRLFAIIIISLLAACWYRDYRNTHETIEIEIREVGGEVME